MNLLIDENVSFRIITRLEAYFETVVHVSSLSNKVMTDRDIWNYAKQHQFIIVTYDEDFYDQQLLKGFPPKLIWLRFGNAKTLQIAEKLIAHITEINTLYLDENIGVIEVY